MNGFIVSPEAEEDVFEIWCYLARETSVEFADGVEAELFDDFAVLARRPGLGHKREDLTKFPVLFYRAFPYQYMIIYRSMASVEIIGVLHAKRNLKQILKQRKQP
ncbi:MAG: type II toxin-antitoxin system RelE/ParE family toxin [bacterium]